MNTGPEYVYVICDVCGRKVRRKDTTKVRDRWNLQNGLVVCNRDLDEINEQNKPIRIKERLVTSPKTLRSEPTDRYAVPETDNRTPGAPTFLEARGSTLGTDIELFWRGPVDVGTSQITGYKVERSTLQAGSYGSTYYTAYVELTPNSGSSNTYYVDTTATLGTSYKYRIYAINGAGTGSASNEAYFPTRANEEIEVFLEISQSASILTTSAGENIKV